MSHSHIVVINYTANEKPWSIKPSLAWSANICDCCVIGAILNRGETGGPPVHGWLPQEPLEGRAAVFGFTPSHRMATSKDSPQLAHIGTNCCRAGRFFRIMEKLDSATDQEAFKKWCATWLLKDISTFSCPLNNHIISLLNSSSKFSSQNTHQNGSGLNRQALGCSWTPYCSHDQWFERVIERIREFFV